MATQRRKAGTAAGNQSSSSYGTMARHVSSNGKRQSGGGGSRSTAIALAAGALVAGAILWLWWQSATAATVAGTPTSSASATTTTTAPEAPAEATTNEAPAVTVDSMQAELAEPRSTWFEVPAGGQSVKVHALEVGPRSIQSTGDPLFVLVHGGSPKQDAEHWRALLAGFAPLGRTIAVDMPGHGESPAARAQPMAILQHVIDAECSAQSPAERNVILVGRSWGGGVVLQSLTLQLRASVRRLVLIAPAGAVPNTIPQDFLQQTPVLLVWAKDDRTIPFARHKQILRAFSQDRLTTLFFDKVVGPNDSPFLGHMPELQRPSEFLQALNSFMADQ